MFNPCQPPQLTELLERPALNRHLTIALRRRTNRVFWQASWSKADARNRTGGSPVPEAPA